MRDFIYENAANIMICNLILWLISIPTATVLLLFGVFSYEIFRAIAVVLLLIYGLSATLCAICS